MNQMRAKSIIRELSSAPRTEPTMTPAWWGWDDDDSLLIVGENMMEDEGDGGNGESVVGVVAGEVVRVEDGDDHDDNEVEGSTDAEVGVAMLEKVRTDPELVGRVLGRSDGDTDEPPKTYYSVPRISLCRSFATPVSYSPDPQGRWTDSLRGTTAQR
jgi:hypothetical protein